MGTPENSKKNSKPETISKDKKEKASSDKDAKATAHNERIEDQYRKNPPKQFTRKAEDIERPEAPL